MRIKPSKIEDDLESFSTKYVFKNYICSISSKESVLANNSIPLKILLVKKKYTKHLKKVKFLEKI